MAQPHHLRHRQRRVLLDRTRGRARKPRLLDRQQCEKHLRRRLLSQHSGPRQHHLLVAQLGRRRRHHLLQPHQPVGRQRPPLPVHHLRRGRHRRVHQDRPRQQAQRRHEPHTRRLHLVHSPGRPPRHRLLLLERHLVVGQQPRLRGPLLHHARHHRKRPPLHQLCCGGPLLQPHPQRGRRIPHPRGEAERQRHLAQRPHQRQSVVPRVGPTHPLQWHTRKTLGSGPPLHQRHLQLQLCRQHLPLCLQTLGQGGHQPERIPLRGRAHRALHQRLHLQRRPHLRLRLRRLPAHGDQHRRLPLARKRCARHPQRPRRHAHLPLVRHQTRRRPPKQTAQQRLHGHRSLPPDIPPRRRHHLQPLLPHPGRLRGLRRRPRRRHPQQHDLQMRHDLGPRPRQTLRIDHLRQRRKPQAHHQL